MISRKNKSRTNKIILNGALSNLEKARNFIYKSALDFGFTENDSFQIALAVDEACTNIMKHSYHFDNTKKFAIEVRHHGKEFQIIIMDEGSSFNPTNVEIVNILDVLKNKQKGGFGIFLITRIMDSIQYFPKSSNYPFNKLVLKKILE
jgi:serine/threonine-protein kinase RsbW